MEVAHILLGRPWLFDVDVTCFWFTNIYVLKHEGKKIILNQSKPTKANKISQMPQEDKPLHLLNKNLLNMKANKRQ